MTKYSLPLLFTGLLTLSACETMNTMQNEVGGWFSNDKGAQEQTISAKKADESIMAAPASDGCPPVEIMSDLKQMVQFSDFTKPVDANKVSDIRIIDIQTACAEEEESYALKMEITFDGMIGPKGMTKGTDQVNFSYPYFIAVTDKDGKILAKEIFSAALTYTKGQDTIKQIETINQLLPKTKDVATYTILIGFQLNEDQLNYNRAQLSPAAGNDADTQPEEEKGKSK